jgi:hypothetical protein
MMIMTFVGKVLVVLQLFLTLSFMSFAGAVYTYHTSWKAKAAGAEKLLNDEKKKTANLESDLSNVKTTLQNETNTAKDEFNKATAQLTIAQDEIKTLTKDLQRFKNDYQVQVALANIANQEAVLRKEESLTQRSVNNQLHDKLDINGNKMNQMEDQLFNLNAENLAIKDKYENLVEKTTFLTQVVRKNNLETDPKKYAASLSPPDDVVGLVEATKDNTNGTVDKVQISLGSDDGLLKGHRLYVYRTGLNSDDKAKYLGEIIVEYLEPRSAVGRLVERSKNGIIEKGDNVTSKL